ncbi:hypothetical protein LAC81_07525 [Ensifer adhaerens]|uniref:hypothetical protein n=1 Tax=Ensifer adhaerens TaxID=106592 RepID=UPI001CBC9A08|nr:hypothetical protein [Ensifer adhaerens]MBZ7921628.1 hypothetical protein [Ensifer adhaerens]UAX94047.1 hypothetical protein LAC78_07520 [Ensifer adhaerens]UAY01681.1 hypothetical protein LAC80_07525 [Ensifer adhaerens]UAY09065.1 hypothetical protein LAC81_07525 [Ensifer adhaerens]
MAGRKQKSAVKTIAEPVDDQSPLNLSRNPIFLFLGGAILISGLLLILAATLTAKQAAGFERMVAWEHRK